MNNENTKIEEVSYDLQAVNETIDNLRSEPNAYNAKIEGWLSNFGQSFKAEQGRTK